jgi:hypothetical protein
MRNRVTERLDDVAGELRRIAISLRSGEDPYISALELDECAEALAVIRNTVERTMYWNDLQDKGILHHARSRNIKTQRHRIEE